jgi:hypothetical protein
MPAPLDFGHGRPQDVAMRNEALVKVGEALAGEWTLTMTGAWFLEDPQLEVTGTATIDWLNDAFLKVRAQLGDEHSTWDWVIGGSDANEQLQVLYHDERGVLRLFAMTFADGSWTMSREDPDFHQRWISTIEPDRIVGRWEASGDQGSTWRKDFDLIWDRRTPEGG